MLSRRDSVIDRLKGRLAGAKDYITKPFKTQEIVAIVQEQLNVPALQQMSVRVLATKGAARLVKMKEDFTCSSPYLLLPTRNIWSS